MKKSVLYNFIVLMIVVSAAGCGYSHTELPGRPDNGGLGDPEKATLNFALLKAQVFEPHCISCHSPEGGRLSLETYAAVKPIAALILSEVQEGSMPPRGPMPAEAVELLTAWVQAGAPENSSVQEAEPPQQAGPVEPPTVPPTIPTEPTPTEPPPTPSIPDFAKVKAQVIDESCLACHTATGKSKGGIKMDTFADVQPIAKLMLKVVKKGEMPPREPLTPEQLAILESWVNAGAPEFVAPLAPNTEPVGFNFNVEMNAFELVNKHTLGEVL